MTLYRIEVNQDRITEAWELIQREGIERDVTNPASIRGQACPANTYLVNDLALHTFDEARIPYKLVEKY